MVVFIEFVIIVVNNEMAVSATKNMSVIALEPNLAAIKDSLTNPSSLLAIVNMIIINADLAALFDLDISSLHI